jgi:hypothetical protein
MEFASQHDYDGHNVHTEHVSIVETRWKPEVLEFLEIDYVPFTPGPDRNPALGWSLKELSPVVVR